MAVPTFVSAGAYLDGVGSSSAAFAAPTGMAAGDIIIVALYKENSAAVTAPSGFTAVDTPAAVTSGNTQWHYVWWKRATGSEPSTYSFTWTGSAYRAGQAIAIRGCVESGSPVDVFNKGANTSSSTSTPAVAVTTTGADRLLVWSATCWNTTVFTAPTNYTLRGSFNETVQAFATRSWPTASASGNAIGTTTDSNTSTAWLIALTPATSYVAPGSAYDIDDFKLTLPTGSGTATEVTQPTLETYADANFNLDGSNRIVMTAPVQGVTTSGSGGTRCEFREMEGGGEANWTIAGTGFRQLTVSGIFDPTNITDRKEMIVGQIHGATGTPPWYLAVEHHVATPRLRVYKDGPGLANVLTGLTASTLITYRVRIYQGRVKMWAAIGGVASLPAAPAFDWAAAEFTDNTGCYLKVGAYNKSEVATGGTGSAIATISFLQLIQPGDPIPPDAAEPGRFLLAY